MQFYFCDKCNNLYKLYLYHAMQLLQFCFNDRCINNLYSKLYFRANICDLYISSFTSLHNMTMGMTQHYFRLYKSSIFITN